MAKHYIVLSSSYFLGQRIALDFVFEGLAEAESIIRWTDKIRNECGEDVSISVHCIETLSKEWRSVKKEDPFFEDVKLINDIDEFISLIKKDRDLTGVDIARYILSVTPCTHLKLQKLSYLCYADYLCATQGKDRLFDSKVFAYTYGPVIEDIYSTCKKFGRGIVTEKDIKKEISGTWRHLSARSKVLFAYRGLEKLASIEDTLERYKKYTAGELINITHREGSPWCHSDSTKSNVPIIDGDILKYHCNEI